jgi:hypothetical protein
MPCKESRTNGIDSALLGEGQPAYRRFGKATHRKIQRGGLADIQIVLAWISTVIAMGASKHSYGAAASI